MSDVTAPLSSLQATLDDTTARVTDLAGVAEREGREEIAMGLWEVERSLKAALRRIESVRREL